MRTLLTGLTVAAAVFFFSGCTKSSSDSGDGGSDSPLAQFQGDCSLRVAHGSQCTPKEGPIALITLVSNKQEIAICTGAFITQNIVLTAAHCFVESGADSALINAAGESGASASFTVHPNYRGGNQTSPYDVAIIKLKDSLNVATLPLSLGQDPSSGMTVNIIGYGMDENGHSAADQSASKSLHKGVMTFLDIEEDLLILTPGSGGQTICPGDSGSPGIVLDGNDRPGILGVASLALGNNISQLEQCQGVAAAAFTNVQFPGVTDWILKVAPDTGTI